MYCKTTHRGRIKKETDLKKNNNNNKWSTTHILGGLLYFCEILPGFSSTNDASVLQHCSTVDHGWMCGRKWTKMSRKFYFSFKYSVPFQSSARRGAHRRAIMWFQCLGPCGIVPSGGKPLRLCWHITAPIISSRSALSFLLHLSSFSFFLCPSSALPVLSSLPLAPSPLLTLNTFLLIFCLNNHTFFFPHSWLRCTALNDCHSHKRITYFT